MASRPSKRAVTQALRSCSAASYRTSAAARARSTAMCASSSQDAIRICSERGGRGSDRVLNMPRVTRGRVAPRIISATRVKHCGEFMKWTRYVVAMIS